MGVLLDLSRLNVSSISLSGSSALHWFIFVYVGPESDGWSAVQGCGFTSLSWCIFFTGNVCRGPRYWLWYSEF